MKTYQYDQFTQYKTLLSLLSLSLSLPLPLQLLPLSLSLSLSLSSVVVKSLTSFFLFVVEAVGCYRDSSRARAIPSLVHNYRGQIDWYNIGDTIAKCANVAQGKGYKVSW